jgi:putative peptide zinc metalloprotease protein
MSTSIFSQYWFRVSDLHPKLRSHVQIERHCYRSDIWYVVKDPLSDRLHRVNSAAYHFVGRLDGRHSIQAIWDTCVEQLGDTAPTQDEVIELLTILSSAELIQTEESPDLKRLFTNKAGRAKLQRRQKLNPLAFKVALGNPSKLLEALAPLFSLILRPFFAILWLILMIVTVISVGASWSEIVTYTKFNLSKTSSLMLIWIAYPIAKLLHELGHGLAIKAWGGEVKEYGVTILAFFPVPYVDASAASGFRSKWHRVLVSLMGLIIELTIAALAFYLWSTVSDGVLRELCFTFMLTCAVSSLLVNGNPLVRFDAYYALSDLLESPGLAQRSNALLTHQAKKWILGVRNVAPPTMAVGERPWLYLYGFGALVYKVIASSVMASWLFTYSFSLGILFSMWALLELIFKPIWELIRFLIQHHNSVNQRGRAFLGSACVLLLTIALVGWIPMPHATQSEGIVWAPEQSRIRPQTDGFIAQVLATDQSFVAVGDPILEIQDPVLLADFSRAQSRLDGLQAAHQLAISKGSSESGALQDDISRVTQEVKRLQDRIDSLIVRAQVSGKLALGHAKDLPGSYVAKGTLIGHVLSPGSTIVRAVLNQSDVALVRDQIQQVTVRLAEKELAISHASVLSQTPASTHELPSAALGEKAGGGFSTDPSDDKGLRAQSQIFIIDVELTDLPLQRVGGRAWVRFDHGSQPLATQWLRSIKQVFLKHLANDRV